MRDSLGKIRMRVYKKQSEHVMYRYMWWGWSKEELRENFIKDYEVKSK